MLDIMGYKSVQQLNKDREKENIVYLCSLFSIYGIFILNIYKYAFKNCSRKLENEHHVGAGIGSFKIVNRAN